MLIDDRNAFVVYRDDERVAKLPQRDHRPDRSRFYGVLLGSTGFYKVLRGSAGVYKVLQGSAECRKRLRRIRRHQVAPWSERLRGPTIADGRAGEHAGNRHRLRLGRTRRERRELQLGRASLTKSVAKCAAQHFVHQRLLEKPHLRFRRMHVDVHAIRRNADEQVHFRAALLDRRDAVRLGYRVRDRPILDDAPVDEDVLRAAHRALIAECRDVAVDLQARGFLTQLDQIETFTEQLKESLAQAVRRGTLNELPARLP